MPSLRISLAPSGPTRSAEFAHSLQSWLNDTLAREVSQTLPGASVHVDLEQANSEAQGDLSIVTLFIEGFVAGSVLGVSHATGERLFEYLGKRVAEWWEKQGRPAVELKGSDGRVRHLTPETENAAALVAEAAMPKDGTP